MSSAAVRPEDVFPVRSRISWGPIFAGAFVALALYLLLNLLGTALGLSLGNRLRGDQLTTTAAVWAVTVTLVALFVGGWVTTQCTAGETRVEALLYGVVLWGVVFTGLMAITATSVRLGFDAMMGMESISNGNPTMHPGVSQADLDKMLDKAAANAGVSREQADRMWASMPTSETMRQLAEDPKLREAAAKTAWWAFAGTLFSMLAAIVGAVAGAGPTPILLRNIVVHTNRAAVPVR